MDEAAAPTALSPTGTPVGLLGFGLSIDPVFDSILLSLPVLFGVILVFLSGPKWRAEIRRWLYGAVWSTAYAGLLDGLLARLGRFFGPALGWRALDRCFALAMIYSIAFSMFQILHSGAWAPPVVLTIMATTGVATFVAFRRLKQWHGRAREGAARPRRIVLHVREHVLYAGALLAILSAVVGAVAGTGSVAMAGAGAGAVAGALAVAGAVAAAVAGAVAVAVAVTVPAAVAGAASLAFFAIPAINALFDWPSWAASRWLMARLVGDASRPRATGRALAILGHVAADLALGVLCLFGLAIAIAGLAHAVGLPGIWEEYRTAQDTPFSGFGAAMTVMLASTLLPTAIHLGFAVFALAVVRPPFASRVAFLAQEDEHGRGEEKGTHLIVALYLVACAGVAMLTLWAAGRLLLMALDAVSPDHAFWRSIFRVADCVVGAPCGL